MRPDCNSADHHIVNYVYVYSIMNLNFHFLGTNIPVKYAHFINNAAPKTNWVRWGLVHKSKVKLILRCKLAE